MWYEDDMTVRYDLRGETHIHSFKCSTTFYTYKRNLKELTVDDWKTDWTLCISTNINYIK